MFEDNFLDKLSTIATMNFFTKGKETTTIRLVNFNRKDSAHLALFNLAKHCKALFNMELEIQMNILDYFLFVMNKNNRGFKRTKTHYGIDCDEFIRDIEEPNNAFGAFSEVYKRYYKR